MTDSHDTLDRYLDDLANGETPINNQLDPELVATIDRLSEIGQNPLPRPDFVDQLEERLMNAVSNVAMVPSPPIRIGRPDTARVTPIHSARSGIGVHRWLPILVSAAVILVVLGLAWRQFGSGEPDRNPQLGAPAIQAPATPSPAAAGDQTLVDVILPADVVPVGEEVNVLLARDTIPANSETTHAPMDCCPGTKTYSILAGKVSVTSDGPMELIQAGTVGTQDVVAAGETANLSPGDTLVVRNEHYQTWTSGGDPVDIITTAIASGFWMTSFDPIEWVGNGAASNSQTIPLPAGPYRLRVLGMNVTADETFPPTTETIIQLGMSSDGTSVGQSSDQTLSVTGVRAPLTVFILRLETAPADAGTPVAGVSSIQPAATATP
jgi:hypothetical protein